VAAGTVVFQVRLASIQSRYRCVCVGPYTRSTSGNRWRACAVALALCLGLARPADAYVGPGAGFAVLSSFLVLFTTLVIVVLSTLLWPIRRLWRLLTSQSRVHPAIDRLVIVGFDGQDPVLTDTFMRAGLLPNFQRLAEMGSYRRLRTTFPALSPVAWSSFSTGCEPGRHNIFDFIEPDRQTYLPRLTSTRVGRVERFFKVGRYRIPREKPELRLLRKSKPFWSILGEHRIWSTVLRVPITFPPDRFHGAQLSAMCVPDLLGTQGTFLLFTTRTGGSAFTEGGLRIVLPSGQDVIDTEVPGPANNFLADAPPSSIPLGLSLDRSRRTVEVRLADTRATLAAGTLSGWIALRFRQAPGVEVRGITRMLVTEMDEHLSIYMAPINIDPDRPAMPISHPSFYASYLAKRIGSYATLGLAEDTWALNEGVIDEDTFLQQTYDIDRERESMFFAGLDRLRQGSLVCVFDATDRIQHMFWRYIDKNHPAGSALNTSKHDDAILDLYRRNDAIVGRAMARLGDHDVLMVISDHGFSSFRRGVNLNAWLHQEGYLMLGTGTDGRSEWLRDVDWSATRAYCMGLTGLFLNLRGRERHGVVSPGEEAARLKAEIMTKLKGLRDRETNTVGIREAFDTVALYAGPYLDNAPDLVVGYNAGYRVSWECAKGVVAGPIFQDNTKAWSGDHCIDPHLVPGVFFCNRATTTDDPALIDIAPTALRLFGIDPPAHMDGRALEGLS
jgi:predicted AlkP superfamily phosphohydrolase/phosphomutase